MRSLFPDFLTFSEKGGNKCARKVERGNVFLSERGGLCSLTKISLRALFDERVHITCENNLWYTRAGLTKKHPKITVDFFLQLF